jgi:alpha-L-fucosidase 2
MQRKCVHIVTAVLLLCSAQIFAAEPVSSNADLLLWYNKPAVAWEDALPIGSGRLGAMAFGGVPDERIQFNEDTLWTGKPHNYDRAGAGDALPLIRQLVFQGKVTEAAALARQRFLSDPVRQKAYQPFGDLRLHFPNDAQATDYRRQLDLDTAIARTSYRVSGVAFEREVFASYPDNVIVVHLTADQPGKLTFTVKMDSPHKISQTTPITTDTLAMTGQVKDNVAPFDLGLRFESRLRAISTGGQLTIAGNAINIEKADAVTLLLVAATSFKDFHDISADPAQRCEAMLSRLNGKSYEMLRDVHVRDHQALFERVKLDLEHPDSASLPTDERLKRVVASANTGNNAKDALAPASLSGSGLESDPGLAALFFQYGRYMLISSSRPGSQPANLQGVWNELLSPPWESKYTTNINVEMNYWPAEVTNLGECCSPLFGMIQDLTLSGARTAHDLYHSDGWVVHHNTDIWRGTAPINNIDGVWPTGGAWLCSHLWEHYLFSGDTDFLEKTAYPAMKGASLFFIESLVKDPTTGYLVTCPSFSPEQGTLCAGPAMDMQLIRALFDSTIQASKILDIDQDFAARLVSIRTQLAPDKIGKYGQLQEWQDDVDKPNNNHRHMSPLWGLYPGAQFTPNDPRIFDAAQVLLKWRGDGSTGWSYAWRIPLWARAYNGDLAYRQLSLQLAKRTFANLFDKCGPFQVDGNFGATAGIAEMLLQSQLHPTGRPDLNQIDLLPALPKAWPSGTVMGLCARGGFDVDMTWRNGALVSAVIHSKIGSPCLLKYAGHQLSLTTTAGNSYRVDAQLRLSPHR